MSEAAPRLEKWEDDKVLKLSRAFCFNPLDFPICTRTPERHNVPSAWIGHVPFAMCLIDMVRPRRLVELGTHWGVSYCAFCQAIKELGLSTECFAVDVWESIQHPAASCYGNGVLSNLKEHHDARYGLFSKLLQCHFQEALGHFEEGSIDVLHIDGCHTYEAVKYDFETWLPKMSNRGVILLHDTAVRDDPSFGAWRFWDEIKQKYPHFAFYHSCGLGLLAVGESIPEGLRPLLDLSQTEGDRIRRYFENLGDHLAKLHTVTMEKERLTELHSQLWFRAVNKAVLLLRRMPFVSRGRRG
jgi:predicted O-methyltransferase YrrM